MARFASCTFLTAAVAGMLSAASALEVVTPAAGDKVVADRWVDFSELGQVLLLPG